MVRLLVHVEGQTEETFTNTVLAPHLYNIGYTNVGARLLGNSRARLNRGGIRDWSVVKKDIRIRLQADQGLVAGLMVDYYALPNSWPGRCDTHRLPVAQRGMHVEQSVLAEFEAETGIVGRFEPHVLLHEFEALLFSDCQSFAEAIGHSAKGMELQAIADQFETPEHINDHPETAPSKRVMAIIPGYQKPLYGNVGAMGIGLDTIRGNCPSFNAWLERLEARAY